MLFPAGADPGDGAGVYFGAEFAEEGAELADVVLGVADVVDVEFEAGGFSAGEAGGAGEGLFSFSIERGGDLLAECGDEGEGVFFGEAGGEVGAAFVAALLVEVAELEGGFAGGEIEVEVEEGVVGDLAEGVVADFVVEVFGRAGGDAVVEHGEGGFELGGEGGNDECGHGFSGGWAWTETS
jgi:hypothetical protein